MTSTHKPKVIAVANQKGGVGKTTTCVNLSTALAAVGKEVLLIDFDPQGNASTGLGIDTDERNHTSYDIIINDLNVNRAIHKTAIPKLDLISATMDLSGAEIEMVSLVEREYRLKSAISRLKPHYDYVVIDCPPSLGLLTLNALAAADSLLIPMQTEFYAMEGLSHLLRTVNLLKAKINPGLTIQGIVLTMFDRRNYLSKQIEWDVRNHFGDLVYKTVIPRNVRISEAPSHGKPAIVYDMQCAGSRAYLKLAGELIRREKISLKETEAA